MTAYVVVFAIGLVVGWRAPVFVSVYRKVRPSCGTAGRAALVAGVAALGVGIAVQ